MGYVSAHDRLGVADLIAIVANRNHDEVRFSKDPKCLKSNEFRVTGPDTNAEQQAHQADRLSVTIPASGAVVTSSRRR